ncbi:E3 ubiquitin-protein ligase NRDP1-like [Artemia franciscana]
MTILFEEHGNHNCIQSLKIELAIVQKENKEKNEEQEEKMSRMQSELDLLKAEIDALKKVIKEKQPASSDLQLLSTVGQSQAVNQGTVLADSIWLTKFKTVQNVQELFNPLVFERSDRFELEYDLLKLRKIAEMQLSGLGCPLEMAKILIENSNETRWPPGLRSEEARRENWDRLKDYRCRVDGSFSVLGVHGKLKAAINLIMASDNAHMDQDLFVINPGFLVLSLDFRAFYCPNQ